jgi:hypothetical protein
MTQVTPVIFCDGSVTGLWLLPTRFLSRKIEEYKDMKLEIQTFKAESNGQQAILKDEVAN